MKRFSKSWTSLKTLKNDCEEACQKNRKICVFCIFVKEIDHPKKISPAAPKKIVKNFLKKSFKIKIVKGFEMALSQFLKKEVYST